MHSFLTLVVCSSANKALLVFEWVIAQQVALVNWMCAMDVQHVHLAKHNSTVGQANTSASVTTTGLHRVESGIISALQSTY